MEEGFRQRNDFRVFMWAVSALLGPYSGGAEAAMESSPPLDVSLSSA